LKAYLVLGCNGFLDGNNIIQCNSVVNPILDLEKIDPSQYKKVMNFLENSCFLFTKTCTDYNMVGNIINLLYKNFSVISDKLIPSIQNFLKMHKICGVYLMIILKEDYYAGR